MSKEGDLDSAEDHSQPIGGTLPLTDKSPPDSVSTKGDPQEKDLPPHPSESEGPTPRDNSNQDTFDYPPDLGDALDERLQDLTKAREETVTTPPPKESEPMVTTPPPEDTLAEEASVEPSAPKESSFHKEDSSANHPSKDLPEAPLGAEDSSVVPPTNKTQRVPPDDLYSRFWSGHTSDTSDLKKRRPGFLTRKPE